MDTFKAAIKTGTYTSDGGSSGHDSSTGVGNIIPPTNAEPPSTAKIDAKTNADQNGIAMTLNVKTKESTNFLEVTLSASTMTGLTIQFT